jgi:hypothetical protein
VFSLDAIRKLGFDPSTGKAFIVPHSESCILSGGSSPAKTGTPNSGNGTPIKNAKSGVGISNSAKTTPKKRIVDSDDDLEIQII